MKTNYYLIDTENVGDRWMDFIDEMQEEDVLVVFYSRNHSKLLEETYLKQRYNKKIRWIECLTGSNALDHQLMGVLSYLVATYTEATYSICSNDKDYQNVIDFWEQRGVEIGTVGFDTSRKGCRWQKIDLTDEQSGQGEGRKQGADGGASSGHGTPSRPAEGTSGNGQTVREKAPDKTAGDSRSAQTKAAEDSRSAQAKAAEDSRSAQAETAGDSRSARAKAAEDSRSAQAETAEDSRPAQTKAAEDNRIPQEERAAEGTGSSRTRRGRSSSGDNKDRQKHRSAQPENQALPLAVQTMDGMTEEQIVAEIARSIPVSNLGSWYTVLVSLLGQEAGLEYYRKLKKDEAWRSELSRYLLKDAHERNVYLIALLYRYHHLDAAKAAEAYKLVNAHNRKNKTAIRADFERHFGKKTEEQNRYYKVVKPVMDVLKGK